MQIFTSTNKKRNTTELFRNVFTEEGEPVTLREVKEEHSRIMQDFLESIMTDEDRMSASDYLESKRSEFEAALEARCIQDDEPYSKLGYNDQVGAVLYQVGTRIYGIVVEGNNLLPVMFR